VFKRSLVFNYSIKRGQRQNEIQTRTPAGIDTVLVRDRMAEQLFRYVPANPSSSPIGIDANSNGCRKIPGTAGLV